MSFFDKLTAGWWWVGQCFEEWYWCMTHSDDSGGDFFCHLQTDYVKYEKDTHYD
jgi:hypothetical protein